MRRVLALITLVAVPILGAACGGSTPSTGSSPPGSAPPPRLHLDAGAGSVGAASLAPAIYPVRPAKYVLDGTLADLGASAPVRRLVPHAVTDADVRHLATVLGLDPGSIVHNGNGFTVSGPDATLTVSVDGGNTFVTYGLGGPQAVSGSSGSNGPVATTVPPTPSTTTTVPPDVPDEQATATNARALLDRMGVLGTEQWSVDVANSGGVAVACPVGLPCPTAPPVVYDRTATFHRVVNGSNVEGTDWSVTIGAHGRVESVSGMWATLTVLGSYPLRPTHDVFADLQAGKARYVGPQPMIAMGALAIASPAPSSVAPVVVHITGVALGYSTWDAFDGSTAHVDLVPTYRFRARATDGGASYDIEVLALDPSVFDIVKSSTGTSIPKNIPVPAPAPAPAPAPVPAPAP